MWMSAPTVYAPSGLVAVTPVTTGATVSTVHVQVAFPTLPAPSVALMVAVCEPSATAPKSNPVVHDASGPPSSEHWKVTLPTFASVAWNANTEWLFTLVGLDGFASGATAGGTRGRGGVAAAAPGPAVGPRVQRFAGAGSGAP